MNDYFNKRDWHRRACYTRLVERYLPFYRPGRPTVILLPGGMGSQLDAVGLPGGPSLTFTLWLEGALLGAVNRIRILPDGRDFDDQFIVPAQELRLLGTYADVGSYLTANGACNFFVFPYDWRHNLYDAAACLELFLAELRARVRDAHGPNEDPLPQTTLLAHSMGGLIARLFLERLRFLGEAQPGRWFERLITAGTPFYGTATHMLRYYAGQEPFNFLYGVETTAAIAASMPGPYILMFLSRDAYENYQRIFAIRDEEPELERYPVRDQQTDGEADPYADIFFARYPRHVSPDHLHKTRDLWSVLTRPLPPGWSTCVFHVRSRSSDKYPTWTEQRWMDGQQGIVGEEGAGDGTVPHWSARLADVPASQILEIDRVDHQDLLRLRSDGNIILKQIATWILSNSTAPALVPPPPVPDAEQQAQTVLVDAQAGRLRRDDPRLQETAVWQALFPRTILC